MITIRRLGISSTLAETLTSTNSIESMISIARRTTGRVTKWKDGSMKKRWIAAGMLEAERPPDQCGDTRGCPSWSKPFAAKSRKVTPAVDTTEE